MTAATAKKTTAPATQGAPADHTRRQATRLPEGVDIKVRHPKFDLSKDRKYWFNGDPLVSHFLNALSMFFPDGEKFFIDSVLHFRDRITDPVLKKHIAAFAAQEQAHTAEHRKYNVQAVGEKTAPKAEYIAGFLLGFARRSPAKWQLAVTVALEHVTATLANEILKDPVYANHMDPEHRALWLWHAAEETEHKSVAADVYKAMGGGYIVRAGALIGASFFLALATAGVWAAFLAKDGELFRLRNIPTFVKWFLVSPGFLRKILPEWAAYFRPGFEPWDQNNSELLAQWKQQYVQA